MIKIYSKLWQIVCFLFFFGLAIAQCNINNFTLTPHNGTCNQDMSITVAAPELSGCSSGTTASIQLAGTTTVQEVVYINASGSATFNNLEQGSYEVFLKNGTITSSVKTINVTTTYNALQVSAIASNTTCADTDPQYTNNGKVVVSYSGGTGNYQITLSGPGGPYTYNTTTAGNHTFSNLAPGNYTALVTDNSSTCSSSEARSATIAQTSWVPLKYSLTRRLLSPLCRIQLRFDFNDGNRNVARIPGNATYTIAGDPTVYNLTPNNTNATGVYAFNTAFGIPPNTDVTYTVTDGCRTITDTVNSGDIQQSFYVQQLKQITDQNCNTVFSFIYRTWEKDIPTPKNVYYWNFSVGRTATYYAEVPAMSGNWVLIESINSDANMSGVAGWTEYQTTYINTRIKIVFSDTNGCNNYEKIVDGRNVPNENNLNKAILNEISGVLEGTSTISVDKNNGANWSGTDSFSYPITFNLVRKDGQTNMTINPTQPYSLAGTYNINFPYVKTYTATPTDFWSSNRPIFGDLPLGEYILTITDGCGYSVTREINLTKPAGYLPTINYNVGCAASDTIYDMGTNPDTHNLGRVYVYENNNGIIGNVVKPYNPNQLLEGTFTNLTPGDYFLVFKNVNYYAKLSTVLPYDSPAYTNSVARGVSGADQEYHTPFTVAPYQQMDFSMVSLFCNPTDSTTGIVGVTATGIPVGFIQYSIWPNTANPNTDTPLQTYQTTNLNELTHVFTGLNAGSYIVRVRTECGSKDNPVTLTPTTPTFPQPVSEPGVVCQGSNTTLAIALPESLFDITWFDSSNNQIGSGSTISFPATQNATYTVKYQLNSTFNCANPYQGTDTVDVVIQGPIQEVSRTTVCSATDSSYTLTVEMSGATTYNVVGTGTPGTWNGNIWTSDPIPAGDQYNVTITDALGCNSVVVTGNSPNCFCYKPASTTGTPLETKHGITALARAGANDDNWPMVRNGAWTALESKTKGFVVNRIATTTAINNLPNPVEGMMVYDEEAGCIKIYTSTDSGNTFSWKCFNIQSCPD